MPLEVLESLYTSENWTKVKGVLTADEAHEGCDVMARAQEAPHYLVPIWRGILLQ